jgi:hypothetical protein
MTEPEAGKPLQVRETMEQQRGVLMQELLACSAANHSTRLSAAASRSRQSARPALRESWCRSALQPALLKVAHCAKKSIARPGGFLDGRSASARGSICFTRCPPICAARTCLSVCLRWPPRTGSLAAADQSATPWLIRVGS